MHRWLRHGAGHDRTGCGHQCVWVRAPRNTSRTRHEYLHTSQFLLQPSSVSHHPLLVLCTLCSAVVRSQHSSGAWNNIPHTFFAMACQMCLTSESRRTG